MAGLQIVSTGLLFGTGLRTTTGLTNGGGLQVSAALSGAAQLLANETQGLAIDFTDLSMVIKDTGTPANAFSGNPNSKLTYSSPSTKWILGANGFYSSGTTLRTSYNASGTALGVLIEDARTNIHLQSTLQSAYAVGAATLTSNAATSPDGTVNAATFVPSAASSQHYMFQTSGVTTTAATYTASVFVKKLGAAGYLVNLDPANVFTIAQTAVFDVANGTVVQVGSSMSSASITAYPNGWYRLSVTYTETAASIIPILYGCTSVASRVFTGDGASGWQVWGWQFELGAFATSPIVTAGSTVTRAADNISATSVVGWLTGPRSAWQSVAGIVFSANMPLAPSINNSASGEQSRTEIFAGSATQANALMRDAAASTLDSNVQTITTLAGGRAVKAGYVYATNDMNTCVDGVLGTPVLTGTIGSTANKFWVGRVYAGTVGAMYLKTYVTVPRRISDAELQAATT